VSPHPGGTQGEEVVAVVLHAHAELDGFHDAGLPQHLIEILHIRRRLEIELVGITAMVELGGLEFFNVLLFVPL